MDLTVEQMGARDRPPDQLDALFAGGWPAFIAADQMAEKHLRRIRQLFAKWEFALVDATTDRLAAAGWGVPLQWNGAVGSLPTGYSDSLARALRDRDDGRAVDTLVICAVQVRADLGRTGIAARVLRALIDAAQSRGLPQVIAPLRPTGKHLHPLVSIGQYALWTRPDGTAHDGWLRTHLAMGGEVIATAPASQIFTAAVDTWERWSGLSMPTSGSYLVPEAIAPLDVDRDRDVGTLTEPCIWVRHR